MSNINTSTKDENLKKTNPQESYAEEESSLKEEDSSFNHGRWIEDEHRRFLEASALYGNKWEKVREYVQTRSCRQIRSHAQKYIINLIKKSDDEEILKNTGEIVRPESVKEMSVSELEKEIVRKFKFAPSRCFDETEIKRSIPSQKYFVIGKFPKFRTLQQIAGNYDTAIGEDLIKNLIPKMNDDEIKQKLLSSTYSKVDKKTENILRMDDLRRMSEVLQIITSHNLDYCNESILGSIGSVISGSGSSHEKYIKITSKPKKKVFKSLGYFGNRKGYQNVNKKTNINDFNNQMGGNIHFIPNSFNNGNVILNNSFSATNLNYNNNVNNITTQNIFAVLSQYDQQQRMLSQSNLGNLLNGASMYQPYFSQQIPGNAPYYPYGFLSQNQRSMYNPQYQQPAYQNYLNQFVNQSMTNKSFIVPNQNTISSYNYSQ